jgi:uncharacterized damage-inducible protein DinB
MGVREWIVIENEQDMLPRVSLLLEQLDVHCNEDEWFVSIETALRGITASEASWSASEKSNTIWQIVNHLMFWNNDVIHRLKGTENPVVPADNDETFGRPGNPDDEIGWQQTVKRFTEVMRKLRVAIESLDETNLDTEYRSDSPLIRRLLGNVMMHDTYHIGQIVLLRKLHNSWKPFDWS